MCAVDRVGRRTPISPIKIAASKREEELCCVFSCLVLKYNRTKDSQHVNVGNRQGEALSLLSDVLKINFSGQQHHSSSQVYRQLFTERHNHCSGPPSGVLDLCRNNYSSH